MKAIQYTAPRQFAVVDLPKPEPGPHQVVIRVKACGICKTDLTIHDGSFLAKFPLVNGHEFAGVIDSVGSAVTKWKVGDRVTADNTELVRLLRAVPQRQAPVLRELQLPRLQHARAALPSMCSSTTTRCSPSATSCPLRRPPLPSPPPARSTAWTASPPASATPSSCSAQAPPASSWPSCSAGRGRAAWSSPIPTPTSWTFCASTALPTWWSWTRPTRPSTPPRSRPSCPRASTLSSTPPGPPRCSSPASTLSTWAARLWPTASAPPTPRYPSAPTTFSARSTPSSGSFAQTHCFGRALEYLESGAVQVKELISHELPLEDYGKGLDYIVQKQARKVIIHP